MSILDLDSFSTTMNTSTPSTGLYNSCSTTIPSIVNSNYSWSTGLPVSIGQITTTHHEKITLEGDNADITVNGKSVLKILSKIEERLAILEPNPTLENEWEELKKLGDKYRQLEAEIKEKLGVWKVLKSND